MEQAGIRLSVDTRLDLLQKISQAIAFAHEQKIVHRGLCPQSVLVWETEP